MLRFRTMNLKIHWAVFASIGWLLVGFCPAQESRTWTSLKGSKIEGQLTAYDGVHFTIRAEGGKMGVIPVAQLISEDREFLKKWREENPNGAWIDPLKLAPWPESSGTGVAKVKEVETPEGSGWVYQSEHFEMHSDRQLPVSVVVDMASIFEATRATVRSLPLGLSAEPPVSPQLRMMLQRYPKLKHDPDWLKVQMFDDPQNYARAGGPAGTSGSYHSWMNRTLISLENVGEKLDDGELRLTEIKNAFVLRHEITHQIMHPWLGNLPMWLREGFAEYMGAAGYSKGRYIFTRMDQYMLQYVNKWRFNENHREIPVLEPHSIMTMSELRWQAALQDAVPIRNYNSAGLMTFYFIHQDGDQTGKPLAAYLDAIRRGVPHKEAEEAHLLRGRTHDEIAVEMQEAWKKKGVTLLFEKLIAQ